MPQNLSAKYSNVSIDYRLWMSSEKGDLIVDDDKWGLLIAISNKGSLMAAADFCQISYRKAWGDIRKIEELLGFAVVQKHRGGKAGGETWLTDDGKKLIEEYIDFRKEFQEKVNIVIKKFKRQLKEKN